MKLFNKKLNLEKTEKILHRYLNKKLKLDFEFSYEDDCLTATAHDVIFKTVNKKISCSFSFFENRKGNFHFILGDIVKNPDVLNLINKYNYDMRGLLMLFVSPEGLLWATRRVDGMQLSDIKFETAVALNSLLDDDSLETLKKLAPLCKN